MDKTLIQEAGTKILKEFADLNKGAEFSEGSLCWQVIQEHNKRIKDGYIAPYRGTDKGNNFVKTLYAMSLTTYSLPSFLYGK